MSNSAATSVTIPLEEIPGPDDWFVWSSESDISTTTAVRICFRSWLAPGRWMADLATLCNFGHAAP